MIVLSFLFIVLVSYCLWNLIKHILWVNRATKMTANIPGPKPWPIIGNAPLFANVRTAEGDTKSCQNIPYIGSYKEKCQIFYLRNHVSPFKFIKPNHASLKFTVPSNPSANSRDFSQIIGHHIDLLQTFDGLYQEYCQPPDKIVKGWIGPKLVVAVCSPKHIEAILSSQDALEKDGIYQFIGLTGNGLFVRNGQEWRDLRKPLDKLLTKKMVESNLEMFHEKALKVCNVINKHAIKGETFNFRLYATNYSADTVTVSNFGCDLNEVEKEENKLLDMFEKLQEATIKMIFHAPNHVSLLYAKLSSDGRRLQNIARSYWNLSCKILKHRINERNKLGEDIDAKPVFYSDVLIQKARRDKLSWEETGRLATDFLVAGFDTSAVTTSYILLMLAMFPEHQEAAYKEQLDILGDNPDVAPTWDQLSKMAYLTRVMKEVIRLYGPIAIFRKLANDIDLGEYKLPKGCMAYVAFFSLHRDPDMWSNPEEFYPDHFLPDAVAARPKGAYFPFSWGPRSCPGSVYAMASIKVIISALIRKYEFQTDLTFDKLEYKYSLLLEASQGYMVRIKPRN